MKNKPEYTTYLHDKFLAAKRDERNAMIYALRQEMKVTHQVSDTNEYHDFVRELLMWCITYK